jgi:hypothetical protein
MGYGYEVKEPNERKVEASRTYLRLASEISLPGSLLVNDIPFCKCSLPLGTGQVRRSFTLVRYVPEWLRWLSYKPLARYGYDLGQEVLHGPMEFVRESIVHILAFNDV